MALRALAIPLVGFLKGKPIHGDGGVQLVFVECNADQVLSDQIARCDAPLLHGRAHGGDACFHYTKRLRWATARVPRASDETSFFIAVHFIRFVAANSAPLGHGAPSAIHFLRVSISAGVSFLPPGGIIPDFDTLYSGLSSGFFLTICIMARSLRSSRTPRITLSASWQRTQLSSRIGFTSRMKSTRAARRPQQTKSTQASGSNRTTPLYRPAVGGEEVSASVVFGIRIYGHKPAIQSRDHRERSFKI